MYYKNTHNNFLLAFIDELWKTQKIRILKKWKRKLLEISSFYVCVPKPTIRYSSRDTEWDKCFFVILGYFLSVTSPSNTPENQNFEKIKKASGYVIILNLCNKNTIKWCMFPQIWRPRDIIFCHFRSFFAVLRHCWLGNLKFGKNVKSTWRYYTFTYVHHKSRSYDVWFLRYKVQRIKLFVILGHFLPFDPPNNPKNFEKIKRCLEILSFYTCVPQMTIMMYGSWHIKHNRQNFLSFWVIFEKMEKATEDTIILHKCTVNDNHMMYGSWDINCNRHIFLSSLAIFCPLLPHYQPKKGKCQKRNNTRRYHHFTKVYQNSWS